MTGQMKDYFTWASSAPGRMITFWLPNGIKLDQQVANAIAFGKTIGIVEVKALP
jgi:hypothetical protein